MESQNHWADALRRLRETNHPLFTIVSGLMITFTTDAITILAPNPSIAGVLEKYRREMPPEVKIKLARGASSKQTLEQTLYALFGNTLIME